MRSILVSILCAAPAFAETTPAHREMPLVATATPARGRSALSVAPLVVEVGLVEDRDFPPLDPTLVDRALARAARTFAERFDVGPPKMLVTGRLDSDSFLRDNVHPDRPRCAGLLSARYAGGGAKAFGPHADAATAFLSRWSIDSLAAFLAPDERATTHAEMFEVARRRFAATVERYGALRTPAGTPLIEPDKSLARSFAAWSCALHDQERFDVVVTNAFILADVMSEPHPHSIFGKAKIGGIAGPNPSRGVLEGQALLVTTFGFDTPLPELSELGGIAASEEERAAILGDYLLAHEIAHSVFGIPDMFDHPAGCLMTSRPNETYREGLALLATNPGACARCRQWVEARAAYDKARSLLDKGQHRAALGALATASQRTPSHFHGGYKRRMSSISVLVSRAYALAGRSTRALEYAEKALELDRSSEQARAQVAALTRTSTGS